MTVMVIFTRLILLGREQALNDADVISGWIWSKERPRPRDLRNFLEGESVNYTLGYVVGGGLTFSGNKMAVELGSMTPRAEFTSNYSEHIGNMTWEGIKPVFWPSSK